MVCYWCVLCAVGEVVWEKHNMSYTFEKFQVFIVVIYVFWSSWLLNIIFSRVSCASLVFQLAEAI